MRSDVAERQAAAELDCRHCLQSGGADQPTFHLGLNTFRVPLALHAVNRAKLTAAMGEARGVALLQGGDQQTRYDTDHEPVFRQESYFQYLFGVSEGGCYGAITLPEGRATLFVPRLDMEAYEIFCGQYPSPEDFKAQYAVDEVLYLEDLQGWIETTLRDADAAAGDAEQAAAKLFLLHGLNSDSGNFAAPASFPGCDEGELLERRDLTLLFDALAEARVCKSAAEVEVMRYVNWVSSMAHVEVMRAARPGMMEYQLESLFQHHTYTHGGCRHMAYTCICACGPNPAYAARSSSRS
jgi:Xaa-Pro dipeptidase